MEIYPMVNLKHVFRNIVKANNYNIALFFSNKEIQMDNDLVQISVENQNLLMANLLLRMGAVITQEALKSAVRSGNLQISELLFKDQNTNLDI